jgi:phosphatidate phosphatase PAH1
MKMFKFELKSTIYFVRNKNVRSGTVVSRKYIDIVDNGYVISYITNDNCTVLEGEAFASEFDLINYMENQNKIPYQDRDR